MSAGIRGVLILIATFGAGIAIGSQYERRHAPSHDMNAMHHVMANLSGDLALDSAQRTAVAAIFSRRQHVIDSTWHRMQPEVHAAIDTTLREVAAVLRPDQLAKFRSMIEVMHPGAVR